MPQQRTLYRAIPYNHSSEQQSRTTGLSNDPAGSAERDRAGDQVSQTGHDALVMYVGCPSRLKLLGLHLGAVSDASPSATEERYPMMAHDDDLSL